MTLLLTESLGSFKVQEKNLAGVMRDNSLKQPITTLYKVRTSNSYRLLMKVGRNNFLELHDKVMYRMRDIAFGDGMVLALAGDINTQISVHDFAVQIAFLKLK